MWIVYLEAAVALALAVFIVWWTLPKRKDSDQKKPPNDDQ
jgi:hypothetical protein